MYSKFLLQVTSSRLQCQWGRFQRLICRYLLLVVVVYIRVQAHKQYTRVKQMNKQRQATDAPATTAIGLLALQMSLAIMEDVALRPVNKGPAHVQPVRPRTVD